MTYYPKRGEVWLADLNPVKGHEQAGKRPVLIISDDTFNSGLAELIICLPITSNDRNIPAHIRISPPDGGLKTKSVVLCDAIRSISKERLNTRLGIISESKIKEIEKVLKILLVL